MDSPDSPLGGVCGLSELDDKKATKPRQFNEIVVGVMGRALEVSPLELCSAVWTANHYHCLLVVRDQQELSRFMHHLGCNISKEIGGRLRQWRGAFWERRYDGIVVSDEPGLIREIEEEGERKRDANPVAGTEKILSQNPYEPPTRRTKRSTKPLFHVASKQTREDLRREALAFLAQYWEASEALRSGNLKAVDWYPEGCYPPPLAFVGQPPPRRPPPPPTRRIEILESGDVERGDIPVVEITGAFRASSPPFGAPRTAEPRARGQPP